MPYFACGGNQLCEDIPSCVEDSDNFEIGLEQQLEEPMVGFLKNSRYL